MYDYKLPLSKGNCLTLSFLKLPISNNDVDKIISYLNLFREPFTNTNVNKKEFRWKDGKWVED